MAKKPIKKKPNQKIAPAEKKSKVDPKTTIDNTSGVLIDCLSGDKKVTKLSSPVLFKIDVEDDSSEVQDPLTKLLQPFGNRDLSGTKITSTSTITDVDAKFSSIAFKLSSRIDILDGGLANINRKFDGAISQLNKKYEADHAASVQNYRKLEAQLSDTKQPTYSKGGLVSKGGHKITGGSRLPVSATDIAALSLLVYPHLKKNYLDPFFAKYDKELGQLSDVIADNRAVVETARKSARIAAGTVSVAQGTVKAARTVTNTVKNVRAYASGKPIPSTPVPIKQPLSAKSLTSAITKRLGRAAFGVLLRNLPVVGLGLAMIDAAERIKRGDKQGATLAAGSGVAGLIPLLGTVTSLGFNAVLVSHDIFRDVHGRHPNLTDPEDIKEIGRILQAMGTFTKAKEAHVKAEIKQAETQAIRQSDEKTFMAAMAKTGQISRGQYTGMEMDEQVAPTTKGGYLFGMIGGTKVPGKTITLDQTKISTPTQTNKPLAYDINMGRMNLGAKGVPGTVKPAENYMAQFAGSTGIINPSLPVQRQAQFVGSTGMINPPLPVQRQLAMTPPLPTMKPQPLSFASNSFRERVYQQKSQFMQFGALPGGFENVMGNRGILGKPVMVAASGAQPFGGGFSGGSPISYRGGAPASDSGSPSSVRPGQPFTSAQKPSDFVPGRKDAVPTEAYADFGDGSIKVNEKGVVDKTQYYNAAVRRIANSELNGFVPKDGHLYGITTGAPEEWANLIMRTTYVESSFNTGTTNSKDEGGSFGLMQWGFHYGITKKNWRDPNAQLDAFVTATKQWVVNGGEYLNPPKSVKGAKRYHGFGGLASMFSTFRNNKVNNPTAVKVANQIAKGGAKRRPITAPKTTIAPKDMGPGYDDFGPSAGVMPDDHRVMKVEPGTPDTIADLSQGLNGRPVDPLDKTAAERNKILAEARAARQRNPNNSMTDPLTGRLGERKMHLGAPGSGVEKKSEARKTIEQNFQRKVDRAGAADTLTQDMSNVRRRKSKEEEARVRARQRRGTPGRSAFNQMAKNPVMRKRAGLDGADSRRKVRANLATVRLPSGKKFKTNKLTAKRFQSFIDEAVKRGYKVDGYIGSLAFRTKRGGRSKSMHWYGSAVDFNPGANPFRSNKTDIPADMVKLAEIYGLIQLQGDNMHFEPASDATWKGLLLTHLEDGIIGRDHPSVKLLLSRGVFKEEEVARFEAFGERDKTLVSPYYAQDEIARMRQSGELPPSNEMNGNTSQEPADVDVDGVPIIAPEPPGMVQPSQSDPLDIGATPTVSAPPMVQPSQSDPLDIGATPTVSAPPMVQPSQSDPLDIGATPTVKAPPPPTNDAKSAILAMDVNDKIADEQTEATRINRDEQARKSKDDDSNNSSRTRVAGGQRGSGQHHPEQEAPRAGSSGYGASGRCWV